MKVNQQAENAESALNNPPSSETQNVGYDDFVIRRSKPPEEAPPEAEEPAEETEEEVDEQDAQPDEEESVAEQEGIAADDPSLDAETVLSQFENLSDEDREKLIREFGTRSAKRIGQLTSRLKQEAEERARLQAKLDERANDNPFEKPAKVENNPFSDLDTFESLQEKAQELSQIDEWADNLLWEHANADPDDVIVTEGGNELTKKQVREYQLNARKGIKTFLPARLKDLQKAELAKQQEQAINQMVSKELPWLSDEESETHKAYKATLENPIIQQIRDKVPEIAPQLNAILAHAINSMSSTSKKKVKTAVQPAKPIKQSPPSNPQGNLGARMSTPNDKLSKQLNELSKRYQESGSIVDYQALRAAQIANRQK